MIAHKGDGMSKWNCDVSLELRDMYILVMCTGEVLADVPCMREQAEVLADEYGLNIVRQTESNWISPGKVVGEFTRHFKVAAYPKAMTSLVDDDAVAA